MIVQENNHYRNENFRENHENHVQGKPVKIRDFDDDTLVINIVNFPQDNKAPK